MRILHDRKKERYFGNRFTGEYIIANIMTRILQTENAKEVNDNLIHYRDNFLNSIFPWDEEFKTKERTRDLTPNVESTTKFKRWTYYRDNYDQSMTLKDFIFDMIWAREDIDWPDLRKETTNG